MILNLELGKVKAKEAINNFIFRSLDEIKILKKKKYEEKLR
jgi:hypothetical protein